MNYVDGEILYLDKPLGWTSFDAVKRVRGAILRRTGLKKIKVGHAGTLDPLATGVMILCTGRKTKLIDSLQAHVKTYRATLALGATTPSFDLETEIDATYSTAHITRQLVETVLSRFTGRIEQVPPSYSACKINGQRAYNLARKGREPELKAKILVIDNITLLDYSQTQITIDVTCSKGTYIRALARDIGQALGTGAHLTALRRLSVGSVTAEMCLAPHDLAQLIATQPVEMPQEN